MAEAEDVIVDAARHATVYAQQMWRRRQRPEAAPVELADVAPRLSLLLAALYGHAPALRVAQPPAPVTVLARWLARDRRPWPTQPVPATDGASLWLPRRLSGVAEPLAAWRLMALRQAERARRGAPAAAAALDAAARDALCVLEADAADAALAARLPALAPALAEARAEALARRPPVSAFAPPRQAFERWLRERLAAPIGAPWPLRQSVDEARRLAPALGAALHADLWTGALLVPAARRGDDAMDDAGDDDDPDAPVRSARLQRQPQVRAPEPGEDDAGLGAWMVQTAQPHESAEDPHGLQRPTDRDDVEAPEAHAESVSELAQARLVRSARRAREVLLSDDAPPPGARVEARDAAQAPSPAVWHYPEWDWKAGLYRHPGAAVHELDAVAGDPAWVARTLAAHGALATGIRRHFEMLRAQRQRLWRQFDGDEPDLDALIAARADFRAGLPLSQRLYRSQRLARRDVAVLLLADVSGSTDGWVTGQRRIVDVEREALLLVSLALEGLGAPYAVQAFSGRGAGRVTVRSLKRFDEPHGDAVALRIAGLEPEHSTRVGAALRHASRLLAQQPAQHRLLVLLSDGKPNDIDHYEGRFGLEDTRQAALEARAQGLSLFCLTVDREAGSYLGHLFGPQHYALLQHPERLAAVLLDWMKRLLQA